MPTKKVFVIAKRTIDGKPPGEPVELPIETADYYQKNGLLVSRGESPDPSRMTEIKDGQSAKAVKPEAKTEPAKATAKKTSQGDK